MKSRDKTSQVLVVLIVALLVTGLPAVAQNASDVAPLTTTSVTEQSVTVEEVSEPADPTQPSKRLLDALVDPTAGAARNQADPLRLPPIVLRALVIVKGKAPAAVLQVGNKFYRAKAGSMLLIDVDQRMIEINVQTVTAGEVRLDLPQFKRTLTLN